MSLLPLATQWRNDHKMGLMIRNLWTCLILDFPVLCLAISDNSVVSYLPSFKILCSYVQKISRVTNLPYLKNASWFVCIGITVD